MKPTHLDCPLVLGCCIGLTPPHLPIMLSRTWAKLNVTIHPLIKIFWLHFCTMGGSRDASSIFIYVSGLTQSSQFLFPVGAAGTCSIHLSLYRGAGSQQRWNCSFVNEVSCLSHSHLKTPLSQQNSNHKCRNVSPSHVHHCRGGMS